MFSEFSVYDLCLIYWFLRTYRNIYYNFDDMERALLFDILNFKDRGVIL